MLCLAISQVGNTLIIPRDAQFRSYARAELKLARSEARRSGGAQHVCVQRTWHERLTDVASLDVFAVGDRQDSRRFFGIRWRNNASARCLIYHVGKRVHWSRHRSQWSWVALVIAPDFPRLWPPRSRQRRSSARWIRVVLQFICTYGSACFVKHALGEVDVPRRWAAWQRVRKVEWKRSRRILGLARDV